MAGRQPTQGKAIDRVTASLAAIAQASARYNPLDPMHYLLPAEAAWRNRKAIARSVVETSRLPPKVLAREAGVRLMAGLNGATDTLTLGMGDRAQALDLALKGVGLGANVHQRYKSIRSSQQARDKFDAEHYPTSRKLGESVGTAAGVYLTGGLGAAGGVARLAPQLPRVALGPRVLAPYALVGGSGAAASLTGQGLSDLATQRLSTPQAYAGALVGGAAGGIATFRGGTNAGALTEAAVAEATQAALEQRRVNLEQVQRNALAGAYLGRLGNVAGAEVSNGLNGGQKEKLGEWLSEKKTNLYGEKIVERQVSEKVKGGHTRVDQKTNTGKFVEAKFGRKATLSDRQKEAPAALGDLYFVDHFLPEDIGTALGGILGSFSAQIPRERRQ